MKWLKLALALAARSVLHPTLGVDLVRVSWRFRNRRWYRRFPFLPLPDRDYVRWRMDTAFGSPDFIPSAHEVEQYARWATRR